MYVLSTIRAYASKVIGWCKKPRHKHQRCSQQDTFTSIIQTTNHPAQVPLAQPNMPVLVPSTPSSEALRKLYFETAKPFFLGYIEEPEEKPTFGGGYSDVYRCPIQFCAPSENLPTEVAVKILRAAWLGSEDPQQRLEQRFWQEAITWLMLPSHPNIVPLIGWTVKPYFSFIYPWYKEGNLSSHLNRLSDTRKLHILLGVAKALQCLHAHIPPMFHGDIKPDNILLSDSGDPLLADFGLSKILGEEAMYTSSHRAGGSMPWMSPECMMEGLKSCQSDVYSFASLAFTVLTGELPYAGLAYGQISVKVCGNNSSNGPIEDWVKYPQLNGPIKGILMGCWSPSPSKRPSMSTIVQQLSSLLESRESQSHPLSL